MNELEKDLINYCPEGLLLTDPDHSILLANRAASILLTGISTPLTGRPILDFVEPGSRSAGFLHRALHGSDLVSERLVIKKPDSSEDAVIALINPLPNGGSVIALRDVTLHEQISQEASDKQEPRENLQEFPSGLIEWDSELRVARWSQGAETIFGWSEAEVIGKHPLEFELVYDYDADQVRHVIVALMTGAEPNVFSLNRNKTKDGRIILCEWYNSIVRDEIGNLRAIVSRVFDVTLQRETELALRRSEEKYKALYEENPLMVFTLDDSGVILDVNNTGAAQLGYRPEELFGKPVFNVFVPEDRDFILQQAKDCLQNPNQVFEWEARKQTKQGRVIWVKETARQLQDTSGKTILLIVCEDITDKKEMQERLAQQHKLESMGRLAGGIAHDFNNLLGIILGFAERAQSSLSYNDPAKKDIAQIIGATNRASSITKQLLAFAARKKTELMAININSVIENAVPVLKEAIKDSVNLKLLLDPQVTGVMLDEAKLEQILLNMTINADDAMPNGGILTIKTFLSDHSVALEISDTGIGMTPDVKSKLFEPFFSTKEPGHGTGLGLATCYGIIEQAGGLITVQSQPGEGSVFTILLNPASPNQEINSIETGELTTGTILLVEDEPLLRHIAADGLRQSGFTVLEASNGNEALDIAAKNQIDLLLTDYSMPVMNGKQLAKNLRMLNPALPVIFMSGFIEDTEALEDVEYVQKPFSLASLATNVSNALKNKKI